MIINGFPSQAKRLEFENTKCSQFKELLRELAAAMEYSLDLETTPWEFSLSMSQLARFQISENDLKWLNAKGWLESRQACEAFPKGGVKICNEPQYIISKKGIEVLGRIGQGVDNSPADDFLEQPDSLPHWDHLRKELRMSGEIVKRFRWPAPNQELVIEVFSEEGWPARIVDPLPPEFGVDPKRRLGDTIKGLNRNHENMIIRFRGDGTGEGVLWDFIDRQSTRSRLHS